MRNAVIGVVVAGLVAWFGLAYFGITVGTPPWELLLPDAILKSEFGWILLLVIPIVLWLAWDRSDKGR